MDRMVWDHTAALEAGMEEMFRSFGRLETLKGAFEHHVALREGMKGQLQDLS
jgi:hypothetical protein